MLDLLCLVPDQATASPHQRSVGAKAKGDEANPPDIPEPHTLFESAWKKVNKNLQRRKSGFVNPGYRFPKPLLFVGVGVPERKKTYFLNWLSVRSLWIDQVDRHPPLKFPTPQMWRDFLNTIDTSLPSSTRSASSKLAVLDILGESIVQAAAKGLAEAREEIVWRGRQVSSSISDLPFCINTF